MAVTRKQSEELVHNVRQLLNRPEEDDFFQFPDEYFEYLSKAHRRIYRKVARANPMVLFTETTVTTSDSGLTYDLGDFHLGQIEVYAPPGPPRGERIPPAYPDSPYFGFWVDGTNLRFTYQQEYSPLYIRWVPETVADLDADGTHSLPAFCEDMLEYETAFLMAQKQGFAGDPGKFQILANREWLGDPNDPSDDGILAILKKQPANAGFENAAGMHSRPWWRGIR
jgi:hypothetical protein